jgi:methylmalonyl-CoA mutase cobalamin-binding domain/chain
LPAATRPLPTENEVEAFAALCIHQDPHSAQDFVKRLMDEGLNIDHIFLNLITPAARYLGAQWDSDHLDFGQVTHGLVRLHAIAHEIGFAYREGPLLQGEIKRIMIAPAPGSEHLLGSTIVAEFFRKSGWQVVIDISSTPDELTEVVANEWFDVVGLSVGIERQLINLRELIATIRTNSRNPRIAVILGGPIFTLHDLQANEFGAEGICTNAQDAVALAVSSLPVN